MLQGKVNAAMQLVTRDANGGVLSLDDLIPIEIGQNREPIQQTTQDILLEKHPKGKPATDDTLLDVMVTLMIYFSKADASRNTWSHWETKHQTQGRLLESSIA